MARRPKRTLTEELTQHAALAASARDTAGALAQLQPDVAEFIVARRMLEDGRALLAARAAAVAADDAPPSSQPALPTP